MPLRWSLLLHIDGLDQNSLQTRAVFMLSAWDGWALIEALGLKRPVSAALIWHQSMWSQPTLLLRLSDSFSHFLGSWRLSSNSGLLRNHSLNPWRVQTRRDEMHFQHYIIKTPATNGWNLAAIIATCKWNDLEILCQTSLISPALRASQSVLASVPVDCSRSWSIAFRSRLAVNSQTSSECDSPCMRGFSDSRLWSDFPCHLPSEHQSWHYSWLWDDSH